MADYPIMYDTAAVEAARTAVRMTSPVVPYWAHSPAHPSQGLTPSKLGALLKAAESGDIVRQMELFSDMLEKEPTIFAALETRQHAVLMKRWELQPIEGTGAKGKRQAERVKSIISSLSLGANIPASPNASEYLDFDGLLRHLLYAVSYGFSAAQFVWDPKTWTITAAKQIEHKHFRWGDPNKQGNAGYNPYELRIFTEENPAMGEPIEPYQHIVHVHKARPAIPSRFGLLRGLSWWYLFKNYMVRSWMQYAEAHGMPLRVGVYEAEEDRAVLEEAVRELGTDAAAVISKGSEIRFEQPQRDSDVHDRIIALVNGEFSKLILGHQSTTESTPGKLGQEDQALAVQMYRIQSDARALEATVNAQMVVPLCVFGEGDVLCRFKIMYEAEEDKNARADRYVKLAPLLAIAEEQIREEFDLREPGENEPTTQLHLGTDPLGSALASAMSTSAGVAAAKANSRVHAHDHHVHAAQTSGYSRRLAKAKAERDAMLQESESAAGDSQKIYAGLIDGLDLKGDIREGIRKNLPDFRKDMAAFCKKRFERAGKIALKGLGIGSITANADKPGRYSLTDASADQFLNWQAFSISVIDGEEIADTLFKKISDGIKRGVDTGITKRQFLEQCLDDAGIGRVNKGHMTTIFRTNLATAHNASKLFGMAQHADRVPGWQFFSIIDGDTTPQCNELDGKTFSNKDRKYFPPLHFNCRSMGVPVTADEWEEEMLEADTGVDVNIPEGFENTAVRDFEKWVSEKRENPAIDSLLNTFKE